MYSFKLYKFKKIFPYYNFDQMEVPDPRSGHRIVCNETNLYVYGGYSPQYIDPFSGLPRDYLFNELWQFNFATKKWMLLPCQETIPSEVASAAILFDGQTLMVFGGTSLPFGVHCSNSIYVCCLNKSEFYHGMRKIETKGTHPAAMYGQALVYYENYLYTIGGTTGYDYSLDIHRLNLNTNTWEEEFINRGIMEDVPEPRYRHEVAFDGCTIYILGGGTNLGAYDFEYIPTYNIKKRKWEKKATKPDPKFENGYGIPGPRLCHSCVQYKDSNGEIFVFMIGGINEPLDYNEFWRLQLSNLQWVKISDRPLPFAVYFHSACVTPYGKMYTFGGINRNNYRRTNIIHCAWITIPKLAEICWEAILYYCPNLGEKHKSSLLASGIPLQFVNRLYNNLC